MSPRGMKLSRRHRAWFYSVFSLLYLSGLTWIILHYSIPRNQTVRSIHPLEPWALSLHGAAAMAALMLLGTLLPAHIKKGWSASLNRKNGIVLIGISLALILTGYAFYYTGSEKLEFLSHWLHLILGLFFPVFLIWHITEGRKARKQASKRPHKPR